MSSKLLSSCGIAVALFCFGLATRLYPGDYDWGRDYVSTLLRGPAGPARVPAIAGLLIFCASLALVFARLACAAEFSKYASVIRIGGIGSMVYDALTFTPMHDLMVTISVVFFLAAVVPLTYTLYAKRDFALFGIGCLCLAVLVASVVSYYSGLFVSALPWAQKASFGLFAVWLTALDREFPRPQVRRGDHAK